MVQSNFILVATLVLPIFGPRALPERIVMQWVPQVVGCCYTLNQHKNYCARHVKPSACDFKTLIGQQNIVACDVLRTARPRGIAIEYEKDANDSRNSMGRGSGRRGSSSNGRVVVNEPPPPSALPQLQPSISSCERCYKNRKCTMYASADNNITNGSNTAPPLGNSGHGRLLQHFTGHLTGADLEYFSKWDRLIDLERHASAKDVISKSWLFESGEKETRDGKCISSLVLDEAALSAAECDDRMALSSDSGRDDNVSIRFVRSNDSAHHTPLTNLSVGVGELRHSKRGWHLIRSKCSPGRRPCPLT